MHPGGALAAAIALGVGLAGCSFQEPAEKPGAKFLTMVAPEVDRSLWSNTELVQGGRAVCDVLDSSNGDKGAVADMLMKGMSPDDDPEALDAWMRDVSAIEAGAVLYFCPEWASSYE